LIICYRSAVSEQLTVAVLGAGIMGSGIAQVAATARYRVRLADALPAQLDRAREATAASLQKLVAQNALTSGEADAAAARIASTTDLDAAADGADIIIEAVVELLDVKREVLARAAGLGAPNALLATNTSQLSITSIAAALPDAADRVVGLHFFNPVVLMRLIEVIRGLATSDDAVERALAFGAALGKETVVCAKDSPGFLTSRISAIVRLECLRMLEEGVGSAADIDRTLRLGLNFPIGPLELGDRNGLDTFLHVLESLEDTLGPRFAPTVGLRNLVAAGRLGRKTGVGIYSYDAAGRRIES
jgi:3-hydroxybutyryl-CoA dehydrogenase